MVLEDSLTESEGKAANESSACGDVFQTVGKVALEVSHESAERHQECVELHQQHFADLPNIIGFF